MFFRSNYSERVSWATLIANGLAFAYFLQRVFDGLSLSTGSAGDLALTVISTIVAFVVLIIILLIIAALLGVASSQDDEPEVDERDRTLIATGERLGGYALNILIVTIIVAILGQYLWPDRFPTEDLADAPTVIVLLISALFLSEILKTVIVLILYRRS